MKKILFVLGALLLGTFAFSQGKFITKNGHISFYSHTSVEDIKADNNQVASILDTETGDIIITALMKSFKFERALMEEHFNENYVESDKFPSAKFKGKLTNTSAVNLKKDGTYEAEFQGDMTIHGVTKNITVKSTIEVKGETISGKAKFPIIPGDYKIEIPSVVKEKFADSMEVTVDLSFAPMKK